MEKLLIIEKSGTKLFHRSEGRSASKVVESSSIQILREPINQILNAQEVNEKVFTIGTAVLSLLIFINLGTVLNIQRLKDIIIRPIGPLIVFCSRFIIMPVLGLSLGHLILPNEQELQLAVFFTALVPISGLASVCTIFLKGNINLSIVATVVNSLFALAMFPCWIYILKYTIFNELQLNVPIFNIILTVVSLIIALITGILLRKLLPRTTYCIFKSIKPLLILFSLFLIVLTIGMKYIVFKGLTTLILLAALILPVLGFLLSYALSKILRQSPADSITIAIETSVLNATVPIVLLQYSLDQTHANITTVIPIIAALASWCLILIIYMIRRCFGWNIQTGIDSFDEKQLLEEISNNYNIN